MESLPKLKTKFTSLHRLQLKRDFESLRVSSKRLNLPEVILYYRSNNNELSNSRLAFSVSKKIGNAVVRNKVKRSLRDGFQKSKALFSGHDILCVVKKPRQALNLDDIRTSFAVGLKRLEV